MFSKRVFSENPSNPLYMWSISECKTVGIHTFLSDCLETLYRWSSLNAEKCTFWIVTFCNGVRKRVPSYSETCAELFGTCAELFRIMFKYLGNPCTFRKSAWRSILSLFFARQTVGIHAFLSSATWNLIRNVQTTRFLDRLRKTGSHIINSYSKSIY